MSDRLDLLLVTPPSRLEVYQELSNELAAIEPPVWSGLIAEFIRHKGYNVGILDAEAQGLTHQQTADAIVDANAVLTVFVIYGQQPSASTQCMPGGTKVCKLVKAASDLPTMVMGTHASALPQQTLLNEPYTYVCEGEGPYTVLGLLEHLKRGRPSKEEVPGLWYMDKGFPRSNPAMAKIKDLDAELPRQAWDLLDMSKYRAHNWHCFHDLSSRKHYASLQTSLGCPYKCTFCCINAPFGGAGIRYWSANNIIQQIDELVTKYGVKNIKIPDEMFVLNRRHVLEICDGIIERGYDVNIWAYARIDTVKDEFLEKLKQAGFNWLGIGIESGSKHVRDGVEKGRFGEQEIIATVNKIREHGINVGANYIFGLPDDTHETMRQTLDLALYLNTEWANFYCAMAYPGSPLYRMAKEHKWALPDDEGGPGWIGYSQHAYDSKPLRTNTLEYTEVLDFRDKAFDEYFTNPSYLSMIGEKFGQDVAEHVRIMTAHKIRRRHNEQTGVTRVQR
jgi:radical SAM superfamily enzyme YgiQ (UPF0313 family)